MNWRSVVTAIAAVFASFSASGQNPPSQQPVAQSQPESVAGSVQETNDAFVQKIMKQIAGHEQEPAEKVFKNVKIMKTVPAGRFLDIMNRGYARALGVACNCHVEQDFSSDEKRPKRAAREMAAMHRGINEQLAKMENLEPNPQGISSTAQRAIGARWIR